MDPAIREKVLDCADRLGYVYDRGAANLRTRQSRLIGLVIPDLANPFIAQIVRGISGVIQDRGYMVTTIETHDDHLRQAKVLQTLAEHRVDGLILLAALGTDASAVPAAFGAGSTVLLGRGTIVDGLDVIEYDEKMIGEVGARHLVETHNCASIAYFGGLEEAPPRKQRMAAVRSLAAAAGVQLDHTWTVASQPTPQGAYLQAKQLIAANRPPAGIYCHADRVAYGLLRALHEAHIPTEQCRVIGAEDLPDSEFWIPSLTSVTVGPLMIGRVAAQHLLSAIGEQLTLETIPIPQLRVRASCGCRPE